MRLVEERGLAAPVRRRLLAATAIHTCHASRQHPRVRYARRVVRMNRTATAAGHHTHRGAGAKLRLGVPRRQHARSQHRRPPPPPHRRRPIRHRRSVAATRRHGGDVGVGTDRRNGRGGPGGAASHSRGKRHPPSPRPQLTPPLFVAANLWMSAGRPSTSGAPPAADAAYFSQRFAATTDLPPPLAARPRPAPSEQARKPSKTRTSPSGYGKRNRGIPGDRKGGGWGASRAAPLVHSPNYPPPLQHATPPQNPPPS